VLDTLKYNNIMIRIGDGTEGWKEFSPYHAIIVTASGPKVPDPLLAQLATGGRLVIPIGDESYQDLIVYTKEGEDRYKEDNHGGVRFVKLIGEHGWKD
jgi:protein-L-isoaspartate(D-aspartate) O-methyltransferase